jgi:hypothetical protein
LIIGAIPCPGHAEAKVRTAVGRVHVTLSQNWERVVEARRGGSRRLRRGEGSAPSEAHDSTLSQEEAAMEKRVLSYDDLAVETFETGAAPTAAALLDGGSDSLTCEFSCPNGCTVLTTCSPDCDGGTQETVPDATVPDATA